MASKQKLVALVENPPTVIDREVESPCNICRKRSCCILRPKEGRCKALEEGEPWVMPNYSLYL